MKNVWTKQYTKEITTLVRQVLITRFGIRPDMEDFEQEALLRLLQKDDLIPNGPTRYSYLHSLILNCVKDLMRKQLRRQMWSFEQNTYNQVMDNYPETPIYENFSGSVQEYSDPFMVQMVSEAVSALSPEHRKVLLLKAEDFEYKEIASVLKISEGTVRSRLHYARKKCATRLADQMH